MSGESILVKLQKIDRRYLYWILFIGLMIPFIRPLGLPVAVTPSTLDLYNELKTLKPGDVVLLNEAFGVGGIPDCMPATVASTKIILRQGAKLIFVSPYVDYQILWARLQESVPDFGQLEYGKDYVFLGFYAGLEAAVAQLGANIRTVFPTDAYGTPLDQIEMMKNVNSARDIQLVLSADTGDWCDYYIRQWHTIYGTPVGEIGIAMLGSSYMPMYRAGVLFGMSVGSRGGAEMEKLIGEPGTATITMDSINVSHLLVIVAVILANIGMLAARGKGGK